MGNIATGTLADVGISKLLDAWNAAFSDYKVKIDMTEWLLSSFMKQNGVQLEKSIGAFDGEELIGIWLNGMRTIDGVSSAYDSGTAIHPEYRSKGISGMMAKKSGEVIRAYGVEQYILEVFTDNERAKGVYLKDGFEITRELICFKNKTPISTTEGSLGNDITFKESAIDDEFMNARSKMEYVPSWQNRDEAVHAIAGQMRAVNISAGGRAMGYGIMQTTRGRIPQIGFADDAWNTDIPSMLLGKLCSLLTEVSEVAIINVDVNATNTIKLFRDAGFEEMVRSYEMKKNIT
ncbi:MAG: GNAT family N-acetyltransferase [Deltaproteobacteria bacterium]|nr:GNAT family N-acetyltransferase [Deltaproteobacteria bacterium]